MVVEFTVSLYIEITEIEKGPIFNIYYVNSQYNLT